MILLTTEAKDDPEIRAQVEHVCWPPWRDVAVAADSPNRSSQLLSPRCVRLGSRSCAASESTPRFAGSTTPGIQARPFVDAPRQEALNDSGAPRFRCCFEWLSPSVGAGHHGHHGRARQCVERQGPPGHERPSTCHRARGSRRTSVLPPAPVGGLPLRCCSAVNREALMFDKGAPVEKACKHPAGLMTRGSEECISG